MECFKTTIVIILTNTIIKSPNKKQTLGQRQCSEFEIFNFAEILPGIAEKLPSSNF